MKFVTTILENFRQSRGRKRLKHQFRMAGYTQIDCPSPLELLPIRFPEIIQFDHVCMFAKDDMQMLVLPVHFLPGTRLPHRGRVFTLMCAPLAGVEPISAALRSAGEHFSIVDQLEMNSYPSLSPLPDFVLFASDDTSANRFLSASYLNLESNLRQPNSLIAHNGRLMIQVSA